MGVPHPSGRLAECGARRRHDRSTRRLNEIDSRCRGIKVLATGLATSGCVSPQTTINAPGESGRATETKWGAKMLTSKHALVLGAAVCALAAGAAQAQTSGAEQAPTSGEPEHAC